MNRSLKISSLVLSGALLVAGTVIAQSRSPFSNTMPHVSTPPPRANPIPAPRPAPIHVPPARPVAPPRPIPVAPPRPAPTTPTVRTPTSTAPRTSVPTTPRTGVPQTQSPTRVAYVPPSKPATPSAPFGAPARSTRPPVGYVHNPFVPPARAIGAGAPIRLVPVPVPTTRIAITPNWERASSLIQSGKADEAMPLITSEMKSNPSLDGMFSTVSEFQKAGIDSPEVQELRTKTLEAAESEISKGADRPLPYIAAAKLSLENGDDEKFKNAAEQLNDKFPDSEYSAYFTGLKKLKENDYKGAEDALRKSEQLGMPNDSVAAFLKAAIDNQEWVWQYAAITGYVVGGWLAGLVLLFGLGRGLSALTLRSAARGAAEVASPAERLLRLVYRGVIALAGVYYYLSLPMVLVCSIAIPLSLGYAALMLPYVNIGLVIIVFVVGSCGILTALSGIRTAFVRVKEIEFGKPVSATEAPELWTTVREVAQRVGTRPVDEIQVVPDAEIAVIERGGMLRRSFNRGKRVLILGIGAMQGLKLNAFKAILAHEYGHFQNRDTAGGNMSLRVNLAMRKFADAIKKRGEIHWYDLAVHFLRLYHYLFRRLTFGASRLQEVLADRVAVLCYGKNALVDGLTHAIRRSIEFDVGVGRAVREGLQNTRPAVAFYSPQAMELDERERVETIVNRILDRETDLDDTHPSPKDRFVLAGRIRAENPALSEETAWDLIAENDHVVGAMNQLVDDYVAGKMRNITLINNFIAEYLTNIIRMNPFPANYVERALVYMDQAKYDRAIADLTQAADRDAKSPRTFYLRARCYRELEKYEEAVEDLKRAEDVCPTRSLGSADRFLFYSLLGVCLARLERHDEAIDALNGAVRATPTSLMARVERGRCHFARQDFAKAMDDFNAAIKNWPKSPEPYLERAKLYESLGRDDKAEIDREKAKVLAPHAIAEHEENVERTREPAVGARRR